MAGGKARRRSDRGVKVSNGQPVKTGQILIRNLSAYKAGINVKGRGTIFSLCAGKVRFSKKKTPYGKIGTYVDVVPAQSA